MFKFIIGVIFLSSVSAQAITCATQDGIKGLSAAKAIDLAYKSGPRAGNYGLEEDVDMGLVFVGEDDPGNRDILVMYPQLNQIIAKTMGDKNYDPKNDFQGMFKPNYFQNRECRRQILITDLEKQGSHRNFTGWINVEVCSPGARKFFAAAEAFYEKQGKKMDSLKKFFAFADQVPNQAEAAGASEEEVEEKKNAVRELHSNLDINGQKGVHYFTKANGHIAPRFSVRITSLYFNLEDDGKTCHMTLDPASPYAGLLSQENHYFSEGNQKDAVAHFEEEKEKVEELLKKQKEDPSVVVFDHDYDRFNFYSSHFDEDGKIVRTPAKLNKTLNNE